MKKTLLLILLLFLISNCTFSQLLKAKEADKYLKGTNVIRFKDKINLPVYIQFSDNISYTVEEALTLLQTKLIKDNNFSFKLNTKQSNSTNEYTYRYVQLYKGIPIEFTSWLVHVKADRVYAMNGEIINSHNQIKHYSFDISEEQALENALKHINAESYMWESVEEENLLKSFYKDNTLSYYPKAELVIVSPDIEFDSSQLVSAYKFNIYSQKPIQRKNVYIDAKSGEVLFSLSLLHDNDVVGTAHTAYSGTKNINTKQTSGNYYVLKDFTRGNGVHTYNCEMTNNYGTAVDFADFDNIWNNINTELDQYATDAHFATASTYDYYLNIHNRNSIDNNGHSLVSYIHFNLIAHGMGSNTNAFWNGQWMTYGDGNINNGISPLTTIDICGHEITHGLTTHTANLNYSNESGALNEAFSDIFGTAIEFYARPENANWTIGEDIGMTMRSLSNPKAYNNPSTYKGEYWAYGSGDYGGVHTNSGPLYHWFYLISQGGSGTNDIGNTFTVDPLGITKAEKIAFRMLTVYLTNNSNYNDAWFYAMQAAADLYGACSDEVKIVGDAFYAIGIATPYVNQSSADFTATFTQSCSTPFTVKFINHSYNADNYLWDFGDGTTSNELHPTHTYNDFGQYNVKLDVSSAVCGNSTNIKNNYIHIADTLICTTLMPNSGNITLTDCNGIIYDSGGPIDYYNGNTNSSITIYAQGSDHIVLNILELDIESGSALGTCDFDYIAFYDGSSTEAPLINNTHYCNSLPTPATISSTGEYITIQFLSDPGLSLNGFKIQYNCVGENLAPTALFIADNQYSCNGTINFTDQSLNNPTSWEWDFGDGCHSNLQNPQHVYTNSGYYTVELNAINASGHNIITKRNYIDILLTDMTHIEDTITTTCIGQAANVNLNINGTAYWYLADNYNNIEHIGNQYTLNTNNFSNDTVLHYKIREVFEQEEHNTGATVCTEGGNMYNANFDHYLIFDSYKPFILQSVTVNAEDEGIRIIQLRTSTQEIIWQITINCPAGINRININKNVQVGENLQLACLGACKLYRTSDISFINYPYTIENILSIKQSSANPNSTNYYYYFYDWKIILPACSTKPKSYYFDIKDCSKTNNINNNDKEIFIYPNPSQGYFYIGSNDTNEGNIDLEITDIVGKQLIHTKTHYNIIQNVETLPDGIYLAKIKHKQTYTILKFIINR